MSRLIAIAGPDGAGKTTVCEHLSKRLEGARIEYGGKARNHKLASTRFAYKVLAAARSGWKPLYLPFCYLWFYPFEYFENRRRFSTSGPGILLFDRHPIDRMVMLADIDLKRTYGKISKVRWLLEKPFRVFWAWVYRNLFPDTTRVFILLPTPALCFERSGGQYPSISDAHIRIESYRETLKTLKREKRFTPIDITEDKDADQISEQILFHLNQEASSS